MPCVLNKYPGNAVCQAADLDQIVVKKYGKHGHVMQHEWNKSEN